eukprot:6009073-Pleurochrysis_carterae.AAC.1
MSETRPRPSRNQSAQCHSFAQYSLLISSSHVILCLAYAAHLQQSCHPLAASHMLQFIEMSIGRRYVHCVPP